MHNGAIMPSEVRHVVDAGGIYPVVQLTGMLDADTAATVRSALVDILAQQPEAVVIDVSGLRLADPTAAAVLRDVARETADWPAAHLALCARDGASRWHSTGLPVWTSRADAFAQLGEPDARQQLGLELEPVVGAARRSRELVTEVCARWEQPGLAGPACIVVTELVNNVVAHAQTPMTVLLALHGDTMTVAVRDHSATVPRLTVPVAPTAYGGRGLLLVDSVAERWGSLRLDDGKVVWAVLQDDPEEPAGARKDLNSAGMPDPARG
jgi:Histidine kinase-like ATPase domain/STAS domain